RTEAMHPPHPLLNPERIPTEVVIDHGPRELQLPTLAARLRAQEHVGPRLERPDGLVFGPGGKATVVRGDAMSVRLEGTSQVLQRPPVLREDPDFLIARFHDRPTA